MKQPVLFLFWLFCNLSFSSALDTLRYLFGDGEFGDTENVKSHEIAKHRSSSTEDLILLFEAEKRAAILMKEVKITNNSMMEDVVSNYLRLIDYDIHNATSDYVFHPINAFQLMKRTYSISKHLEDLIRQIPKLEPLVSSLTSVTDDYGRAHHGIADLHEYINLDPMDLSKGIIKDNLHGTKYHSNSKLSSTDLLYIAIEAKKVHYYEGYVNWISAALKVGKKEGLSSKDLHNLKKALINGKELHDQSYMNLPLMFIKRAKIFPHLREVPYKISKKSAGQVEAMAQHLEWYNKHVLDENLIPSKHYWDSVDVGRKIDIFYRRRIQHLCSGVSLVPLSHEKHLKCVFLNHQDSFLLLGPFKFEQKHSNPEIGLLHDFISVNESTNVQNLARGKMKSTPYISKGDSKDFSKDRTSKVMYMNELLVPEAMAISKKIELATHFQLKHEKFASENYQVMNYGIGGKISTHIDSPGFIFGENRTESKDLSRSTEALQFGGFRAVTFMVYLTSTQSGGYTVFPQAGISVKPEAGSALYWFNQGAQNNYDSRINHLGCPVLHGNKWIANKWIKWLANFKNFPCLIGQRYYSIMRNHMSANKSQ